ncbi:uncharacterized [Tachysurus ichikawai]
MLEEKERLKEEWRTFEEQRKNFEMERRSFTEAAIRLGHEILVKNRNTYRLLKRRSSIANKRLARSSKGRRNRTEDLD